MIKKIFQPKPAVVLLCVLLAALSMIYVFGLGHEGEPFSYVAYLFSAYSLTIFLVWLVKAILPPLTAWLDKYPFFHRYRTEASFRIRTNLHITVFINLAYAVMKLCTGVYYRSTWLITLAFYYGLLTVMRFSLLRNTSVETMGKDLRAEYKKYRGSGVVILLMNFALMGIVLLVLHQNQSFDYAGTLIFAMAAYTFFAVIHALVGIGKIRGYGSPVFSAAKVVSMIAALVSLLSLEVAMLSRFGATDDPLFRRNMIIITGGGISLIFIFTGVYMIAHASRKLKEV